MSNEAENEEQVDLKTNELNPSISEIDELNELLEKEKQNTNDYIEKWKRALADYENLKKRTDLDISNKVTVEVNKVMLNFLTIYEDLIRAKNMLVDDQKNIEGYMDRKNKKGKK